MHNNYNEYLKFNLETATRIISEFVLTEATRIIIEFIGEYKNEVFQGEFDYNCKLEYLTIKVDSTLSISSELTIKFGELLHKARNNDGNVKFVEFVDILRQFYDREFHNMFYYAEYYQLVYPVY